MPAEVRWLPEAAADPQRAADWYRSHDDGARLVARFERAVTRELEHVLRAPERWPVVREQLAFPPATAFPHPGELLLQAVRFR